MFLICVIIIRNREWGDIVRNLFGRFDRFIMAMSYTVIIFLLFLGYVISGGEQMLFNALIMPMSGALGYFVFRWRAVYKLPLLFMSVALFVGFIGLVELDVYSLFVWTVIYMALALGGVAIAFLFHFGSGKIYKYEGRARGLGISASLFAVLLTVGACWIINGLVGNPVSYLLAKGGAEKYIAENYYDTDFFVEDIGFSFKDGCYHAKVSSPSSADSYFSVVFGMDGRLVYENYEDSIIRRGNTARRLENEYRERVDAVLNSSAFGYDVNIGFGELIFVGRDEAAEYGAPEHAPAREDLMLDGLYDVNALGASAGELTVYIYDSTVSAERLADILLDIKRMFDASGVSFYSIDCVLESQKNKYGEKDDARFEVMDLKYSDIYAEGLVDRVTASNSAAREYYAGQEK